VIGPSSSRPGFSWPRSATTARASPMHGGLKAYAGCRHHPGSARSRHPRRVDQERRLNHADTCFAAPNGFSPGDQGPLPSTVRRTRRRETRGRRNCSTGCSEALPLYKQRECRQTHSLLPTEIAISGLDAGGNVRCLAGSAYDYRRPCTPTRQPSTRHRTAWFNTENVLHNPLYHLDCGGLYGPHHDEVVEAVHSVAPDATQDD